MSNRIQLGVKRFAATLTVATSVLSLSGLGILAPTVAMAAVPADYGLREGDVISANGNPGDVGFDPDLYIVNDWGYKRLFLNPAIFNFYGHLGGFAAVKKVSPATRDAFPTSGLFRNCETNDQRVYGVEVTAEDSGVLHWVNTTGAQAAIDDPNFFKKVFCINNNEFAWYPKGSDYTSVNQVPDYNRQGPGQSGTPTPAAGGLNGTVGDLDSAEYVGSLNNEEVGEGEEDVAVAGLDLEADNGSDIRLLSAKVAFREDDDGADSQDLDDYADEVSLWFDGSKVGEINVDDLDDDSGIWSGNIAISSSTIIRMGDTEQLSVAVSSIGNIDSADLDNDAWEVRFESVRYVDAQGAITTETSLDAIGELDVEDDADNRAFDFVDFATAADLELEMDEASDNPEGRVHDVDDSSETENIVLLTGDLTATGGDLDVQEMLFTVTPDGEAMENIVTELMLEIDGDVVQSLSSTESDDGDHATPDEPTDYLFDDVDVAIGEDDEVKFRLLVNVNGTDEYPEGTSLEAAVDNTDTIVEDENGDELSGGELTGSVAGEAQGLYSEGITVEFVSASESKVTDDTDPDLGTFEIKFEVTAFDTDAFITNDCVEGTGPSSGEGTAYVLDGSAASSACVLDNSDETIGGNFEVNDGETHEFTLTVSVTGADDFVSVALESINWASNDVDQDQFYTFNLDEFETDALFLAI